jgi:nucleoside-diphosphate-sugar epimerase
VSDTVDGLVRMIESERANGEIFNIGSVHEITIKDLAYLIKKLSCTSGELKARFVPYESFGKYEDVRRRVPSIDKAKRLLGFDPQVSLEEGLQKTIAWQKEQIGL